MSNLQEVRNRRGLTQKQLAEKSGVPLVMVQKYEQKVKNINNAQVTTVLNLAQALKVAPRDILEREE